jgi:protein-tyrosine phosphatase/nicotinamidase-related amidase
MARMGLSVLLTQCLQRDFVDLVPPHEPLPNKLHVGREEALRLLGADPSAGPIAQLMRWARAQSAERLAIVHVRDWHDPRDPRQADHLAMFGRHCIAGTVGARLVLDLDDAVSDRPNESMVDAIGLNDFEGTRLLDLVPGLLARGPLRVGVVGVWTEAKVMFNLYDLKTRYGIDALATCSALTASASRTQHFNALEQLGKILGVTCFDSVGDFTEWLVPDGERPSLPRARTVGGVGVELEAGEALSSEDRDILGYLYKDSSRVKLAALSGGYSGARVFRASSQDAFGHEQAPSVTKLGPRQLVGAERVAFERVEAVLGNNAPSVKGFVDFGARAGIKYAFASMGGQVRTLKSLFDAGASQEQIDDVLHAVFTDILGRLYAAAQYERLPLLEHYGFRREWAPSVREAVARVAGADAARHAVLPRFYEEFLASSATEPGEYHFVSYVHGDLNGANVLVDARGNVWIIDYFHTGRGHTLKDAAKLENDVLYIYTPVDDEDAAMGEALAISRALRAVEDLAAPLPERIDGVRSPPFVRAWSTVRTLRGEVARLCRSDRDPQQLRIALLRYAVHTLSFEESSPLQKKWALATACMLAEDVMRTVRANRRLRVDWISSPRLAGSGGRIGMTLLPGRKDRGRSLAEDLDVLAEADVHHILCLVTDEELEWAGVPTLKEDAAARGIEVRQLPIRDQGVPSLHDADEATRWVLESVDAGEDVVLHCMGGLGRTGTLAACALVTRGASAEEAIAAVRQARGPRAVEIEEQARFVREVAARRDADPGL